MVATLADVLEVMKSFVPSYLAEKWDNVGLQVGQKDWPVRTIWVALDPLPDVVAAACRQDIDLLFTHHPLIFQPLRSIDFGTAVGSIIQMAAEHRTAIFSAHTNLDSAAGGINDVLAGRIGLKNLKVLGKTIAPENYKLVVHVPVDHEKKLLSENRQGPGRVGELDRPMELASFARLIKERLEIKSVQMAGKPDLPVAKAAVCSGSGSGLMNDFFSSGAQVYISGDLRYHDARAVEAANRGLIDIGHFASEHLIVDVLAERLGKVLAETGIDVTIEACGLEKDPFVILGS